LGKVSIGRCAGKKNNMLVKRSGKGEGDVTQKEKKKHNFREEISPDVSLSLLFLSGREEKKEGERKECA